SGGTLAGPSQDFSWAAASGATGYAIHAGSSVGGYNYFSSLFAGTTGTVIGLPTNGSVVHIRLWTNFGGSWQSRDYQYKAGSGTAAVMSAPAPGATLAGPSQDFSWAAAPGATGYAMYAGSSVGAFDYFALLFPGT